MCTCTSMVLGMESRDRLGEFIAALEQVIARHDVLRTSVAWEGLPEPVQVVWRRASAAGHRGEPGGRRRRVRPRPGGRAAGGGPGGDGLVPGAAAAADGRGRAGQRPVAGAAADRITWCWTMQGLEMVLEEIAALLAGRADALPEPLPFRDFVAQARLGALAARSTSGTSPPCWGT